MMWFVVVWLLIGFLCSVRVLFLPDLCLVQDRYVIGLFLLATGNLLSLGFTIAMLARGVLL